jgi:hypothetical protein
MSKVPYATFDVLTTNNLRENHFFIKKLFKKDFEKKILSKLGNCYFFSVSIGYFSIEINLWKINMNSDLIERQPYFLGGYSSIFIEHF